ncbi:hypothetical protein OUZ56_011165 [Daphnia magna]|uniref:Uncharacterized protein n=1 Tax=Daphnia magna TaxID=35525 RepID=A0ABQ9YZF0_9CRUS|nr:hypothetical protein OUZ56_011165 [Daphnia magna]
MQTLNLDSNHLPQEEELEWSRATNALCKTFVFGAILNRKTAINIYVIDYRVDSQRGIRTLAQKTGLRPERSALDRSAILTSIGNSSKYPIQRR